MPRRTRSIFSLSFVLIFVLLVVGCAEDEPDFPLEVTKASLVPQADGPPILTVRVINTGAERIDGWSLVFHPRNDLDRPLREWGFGETSWRVVDNGDLVPGQEVERSWPVEGFDNAANGELLLRSARSELDRDFYCDQEVNPWCRTWVFSDGR